MSSGRLFLDRVGRHQSPSPLRRHAQTTTHARPAHSKPELSTLPGSGTFYFALTVGPVGLANRKSAKKNCSCDRFPALSACEKVTGKRSRPHFQMENCNSHSTADGVHKPRRKSNEDDFVCCMEHESHGFVRDWMSSRPFVFHIETFGLKPSLTNLP